MWWYFFSVNVPKRCDLEHGSLHATGFTRGGEEKEEKEPAENEADRMRFWKRLPWRIRLQASLFGRGDVPAASDLLLLSRVKLSESCRKQEIRSSKLDCFVKSLLEGLQFLITEVEHETLLIEEHHVNFLYNGKKIVPVEIYGNWNEIITSYLHYCNSTGKLLLLKSVNCFVVPGFIGFEKFHSFSS